MQTKLNDINHRFSKDLYFCRVTGKILENDQLQKTIHDEKRDNQTKSREKSHYFLKFWKGYRITTIAEYRILVSLTVWDHFEFLRLHRTHILRR